MFREKVAPTQDLGGCHLPSATGVVLGWGAFWAVGGRWAGKRVAGGCYYHYGLRPTYVPRVGGVSRAMADRRGEVDT